MDYNLPGSSVHGISQTRILEWVVISFPRGSSWPKDWTHISCIGRWVICHWATWEALPIVYKIILNSTMLTLKKKFEWVYNTLAISCQELTRWKRPWCWEELGAGGEGDDRGWDGWMASLTRWTWVWVNSGSWWWTGRPGVLQFMGSQRVGHNWATELNF